MAYAPRSPDTLTASKTPLMPAKAVGEQSAYGFGVSLHGLDNRPHSKWYNDQS